MLALSCSTISSYCTVLVLLLQLFNSNGARTQRQQRTEKTTTRTQRQQESGQPPHPSPPPTHHPPPTTHHPPPTTTTTYFHWHTQQYCQILLTNVLGTSIDFSPTPRQQTQFLVHRLPFHPPVPRNTMPVDLLPSPSSSPAPGLYTKYTRSSPPPTINTTRASSHPILFHGRVHGTILVKATMHP